MAGYVPLKIMAFETGLVQNRENFLLPDDAYPKLLNAYVWRERIKRKNGFELLGRLRRNLTTQSLGDTIASGVQFNLFTQINLTGSISGITNANPGEVTTAANHLLQTGQIVTITNITGMTEVNNKTYTITVTAADKFTIGIDTSGFGAYGGAGNWEVNDTSTETIKNIVPGTVVITTPGPIVYTDQGDGTLDSSPAGDSGIINYTNGNITLTTVAAGTSTVTFSYYPSLPVMGIRIEELDNSIIDQTIFFDQVYAYIFNSGTNQFQEWIPGTTWNKAGTGVNSTNFFWSTNWWVSQSPVFSSSTLNKKLFWVTNNTGSDGANSDPPRITDGTQWIDFYDDTTVTNTPWAQLDAGPNYLVNWLAMVPFRSRLVVFNTWEGSSAANSIHYRNRIRWSQIGNPFEPYASGPPATGSWRDDIRGKGGFLDIPTSEDIISVGFIRDNLVIYCEKSTWQLRYTGRSIAPFQIEKVNTELGIGGPFSLVQFDTSTIGIGNRGVIECDSYKADRIDIKIPDYVFDIVDTSTNMYRVHGIRDFVNRLAYWTIPQSSAFAPISTTDRIYPNRRLVYNYENDSWSLFTDTLTTLGIFQPSTSRTWLTTKIPWIQCNFNWINSRQAGNPEIVGGTQHGFIEYLNKTNTNGSSIFISNIVGHTTTPTVITSPNHNLVTGTIIKITGIVGTPYSNLNDEIFSVAVIDANNFSLYKYSSATGEFSSGQLDIPPADPYVGGGVIAVRDNFTIQSKKFNFLDEGQSIQMGYIDILMEATGIDNPGAISMNIYVDYNDEEAVNTTPQNEINDYSNPKNPDTFFNSVIPTTPSVLNKKGGTKFWQRVYCPTRANFLTIEFTLNNAQMAGQEQELNVQIDSQVLWIRRAGRMTQF